MGCKDTHFFKTRKSFWEKFLFYFFLSEDMTI